MLSALAYSLTRSGTHARLTAAAGTPIDRSGIALLRVLAEGQEPLRVGELAQRLGVRHPHVTRQVRQLAEQGLVERAENGGDRRVQLVSPTQHGRDTLARLVGTVEAKLAESLADVDPERIMAAVDVLSRVGKWSWDSAATPPDAQAPEDAEPGG